MLGVPRGQAWFRRVALVLGGTLIVMVVWSVIQEGAVEGLRTDWTAFDNAASRLLAGEDIYRPWDGEVETLPYLCLLYTSPSPRDRQKPRMPSSA